MNEIELLRRLRDELPAVRPEARAAARARLLAHAEPAVRRRTSSSRWRRPRLRLAFAGIGLAALLIALPIGVFGGDGETQPAVAQALDRAAAVAATQEPVVPGPGQFLYTRSESAYLSAVGYNPSCRGRRPCEVTDEWSVLVPSIHEAWVPFDDSLRGRVREVRGKPRFVSADQRAGWVAAGSPSLGRPGQVDDTTLSGAEALTGAERLPTDPATLREMIEAREIPGVDGPPGEAETFMLIGDMLRNSYFPAALRAALYRVTAELPGVELLGEVRDPVGRLGIGIAYTDSRRGTRHELIFDPETSALLGERESLVRSGAYGFEAPTGTPIGYAAYLESKVVDSVGVDPPPGAGTLDMSVGCYERASLGAGAAILHDPDPLAICTRLWREGVVDARLGASERPVACVKEGSAAVHVFPGSGSEVCRRLGLSPWRGW